MDFDLSALLQLQEELYPNFVKTNIMKEVLIVEDDINIVELLKINLQDLDCHIHVSVTGGDALEIALKHKLDLIILDLMLPGYNGIDICRSMRLHHIFSPILILTAKSEEGDKITGLESGADDYITKPFSIKELLARVKSIFRRDQILRDNASAQNLQKLSFEGLQIEVENRKVTAQGKKVELSPKEFDLLMLFACNPGRSYSREKILNLVWGYDFEGFEHTVNSHINRLRMKIEPDISKPTYILTTWGVGYRFSEEI